jgi:hypothetical protein
MTTTDEMESEIVCLIARLILCEDRQERERLAQRLAALAGEMGDRLARGRLLAVIESALGE